MFSANTKENASATMADAQATANSAKRDFRNQTEDSRSELTLIAEKAGREVRHFIDNAGDQITDASDRVTGEIRNHPVRSSAVALGIGVVLGALLRR